MPRTIRAADHLSRSANARISGAWWPGCCRRWPPSDAISPWAARLGCPRDSCATCTLIAIIAMVVFGGPAAGFSITTPLLASPWNVIGQGLPPPAAVSAARGVIYLGGANLTRPMAVLATYAATGTLLTLAATAWRRHRPASRAPQYAAQVVGATAETSLAS